MAWRFPLAARLTITLTGVTVLTLASAAFMQDRALSKGLNAVAADRLNRSARTVERIASEHLRGVVTRYVALTRNPELRTSLELGDRPAAEGLARSLARRSGATGLMLADAQWKVLAHFATARQPGNSIKAWRAMGGDDLRAAACVDDRRPRLRLARSGAICARRRRSSTWAAFLTFWC